MSTNISQPQFALSCNISSPSPPLSDGTYSNGHAFLIEMDSVGFFQYYLNFNEGTGYADPSTYGVNDVKVGDWIGTSAGRGACYQILSIQDPPTLGSVASYVVADIDGYCAAIFGSSNFTVGAACIFRVNEDGIPGLGTESTDAFFAGLTNPLSWISDMVARFALRNNKTQYVTIYQPVEPRGKDLVVGESIYIDSSGVFQKSAGSLNISDTVGIVTSKGIPSDDWFSFRPSGKYFDTSVVPNDFFPTPAIIEQVSGSNVTLVGGMKLYINPNAGRQYTTVPPASSPYATWIMIDATRAIYIAGSGGGGGGGGGGTTAVQVFDGGDPYWVSAPPTTIYPVLDCGGI